MKLKQMERATFSPSSSGLFGLLLAVFVLGGSGQARHIWQYTKGGTQYRLEHCLRQPSDLVQCTFTIKNAHKDLRYAHRVQSARLISPKGVTAPLFSYKFADKVFLAGSKENIFVQKGLAYSLTLNFAHYPTNEISAFEIKGAGTQHNIIIGRKAVAQAPSHTAQTASQSATQTAQTTPRGRTKALPGLAKWRQNVEVGDGLYTALLHSCFVAQNAPQATCLVSLLPKRNQGNMMDDITTYKTLLMQIEGQKVIDGKVNVRVGDKVFRDVPIEAP